VAIRHVWQKITPREQLPRPARLGAITRKFSWHDGAGGSLRLASKLALAVVIIMVVIFGYRGYEANLRQVTRARADLREDHFIIARALRPAIKEVWRLEGRDRALAIVDFADDRIQRARQVRIRWLSLEGPAAGADGRRLTATELEQMRTNEDVTISKLEGGVLYTYVPVEVETRVPGALMISEPTQPHEAQWQAERRATLLRTASAALLSIVAVSGLGFAMVGRPLRRLAEMAERIGAGDLDARLQLEQRDEVGQLARAMNHMSDRLRAANQRLHEESAARIGALEQLRHTDRLHTVGTLASGVAHELGTPLNVVAGRAKMIATGEAVGVEATESARTIVDQVDRIAKIIRQLLDFARRRVPDRGRHRLAAVAEQSLALLRPLAQKKAIVLALKDEAPGVEADIDAGQIQQALANLVLNGIQAMSDGGLLEVTLSVERTTPPNEVGGGPAVFARLAVADEGSGISPHHVSRVFEPFFTTKDIGEGTGLGLSVSYGIARDHDGWIAVDSDPGRGSRFVLYLPLQGQPAKELRA
jgi:two-component system NtrC family sensor kinase